MLRISKERWEFILAQAGVLDGAALMSLATSPRLALITFGRSTRLHSTSYVTHRVSLHVNNLHRNRERAPGVYTHMHANVVRALSRARDLSCGCATVYILSYLIPVLLHPSDDLFSRHARDLVQRRCSSRH